MNYILKRLPNPDMIKFQNSVVILFLVFLIYDLNDLKIKIRMGLRKHSFKSIYIKVCKALFSDHDNKSKKKCF